mmetsp:Transcript_12268/g.49426  ORF Transcript_12268/g.49426 Transcript_12268/m.49426 type:complete len:90 (-) Transcript_12268:225-494(-)
MSPAEMIRKKHPELKPSAEYGKEFLTAIEPGKPFWGGDAPGAADLSYYGTLTAFMKADLAPAKAHLEAAGLNEWYARMTAAVPTTTAEA